MTDRVARLLELQADIDAQLNATDAEDRAKQVWLNRNRNAAYDRKVAALMRERQAEADKRTSIDRWAKMGVPEKDRRFLAQGVDRHGQAWRQGEAVLALKRALAAGNRAVVLVGPHQTGKSSATARSLIRLCRKRDTWLAGRFIRGADLARQARLPSNDLGQWLNAPVLVLDEAGDEEHRDGIRHLLNSRDDRDDGSWITLVTCNRPAIDGASCIYGPRVASRWLEAGLAVERVSERMVP